LTRGQSLDFEQIYREHYAFVWRTLRRMGVSEGDVKDAGQKVFLIAHRRLPEFEGRSSVKTWLCGIALRVAADHRRSRLSRREVLLDPTLLGESNDAGPLRQLEQREQLAELDASLAQLPVEQRTVLVLFELEEMSGEEIAQLLGVPEGTIRSRLRLARQAFCKLVAARSGASAKLARAGAR
jgi:RNA polymerase sigma-70 factor, ECF subfamily